MIDSDDLDKQLELLEVYIFLFKYGRPLEIPELPYSFEVFQIQFNAGCEEFDSSLYKSRRECFHLTINAVLSDIQTFCIHHQNV